MEKQTNNAKFFRVSLLFPNFRNYEKYSATPHQPALSLGYLSSILLQNNVPVQVIDAPAENLTQPEILQRIQDFKPDYIGITSNVAIAYASVCEALYLKIHYPKAKVILGGPWASSEYISILENKFADLVIRGEGEYVFLEISKTDPGNLAMLSKIQGVSVMLNGKITDNGQTPYIQDLDSLPFPKWHLFPKNGYTRTARAHPFYPLQTSRGCPYGCINCTKIIHGMKIRNRSIENIVRELDYIKEIGGKEIAIEDDMFNYDLKRIKRLLLEIIKRKYGFKIQLSNGIRADKVDPLLAKLMYAAGVYKVAIGIESGSQKVVDFINKGLDLKKVPLAVKILQKENIKVFGYFILGLPIENYQSLLYSIDYADKINLDSMVYMKVCVFPHTKLYDYLHRNKNVKLENKPLNPKINYQYSELQFSTENLNEKIIKKVQLYYFIRFFLNPRKLFKLIACYRLPDLINQVKTQLTIFIKRKHF